MSGHSTHSGSDLDMDKKNHADAVDMVEDAGRNLDTIEETPIGRYAWMVTLAAAIGGLLFGYDTGVISGVLVVLGDDLGHELSSSEKELITSITSGGAFIGAIVAGFTADRFGRKVVIAGGCVVFTIGAIIQAAAFELIQMTVGRFVIGWGVGLAAMIVPIYIAELAPAKFRGRMITVDSMAITGGQVIAYAIGAGFETIPHGWRWMVGLGGVPSIALLCMLPFCPESPRQLVSHNKRDEAARVLHLIYPEATVAQVNDKIELIDRGIKEVEEITQGMSLMKSIKQLYTVGANFRALFVACFVMTLQQMSGFNTLMYYSATLFAMVGFNNPAAVGLVVAGTNFIFTGVSLQCIDRVGRRRIMVWTIWGMVVGLTLCAVAFHWIPVDDDLKVTSTGMNWAGILVLVSIIIYVAFYATGLGNVPWSTTELLPLEVRAMGTMMVTCCCWGFNIIVSATFLSMMKGITPTGAFAFYAALCFIGWIGVILIYPEVSGMTLEQVRQVFSNGFGVKYAEQWRKENRQAIKDARENAVPSMHA
ncbi:myo-inositol transporter [Geopyxis carbonaria]|nr:myo-inositol transporter [Geopyxis carbonaria]